MVKFCESAFNLQIQVFASARNTSKWVYEMPLKLGYNYLHIYFSIFDHLILIIPRILIKLKPFISCQIAEIVMLRLFLLVKELKGKKEGQETKPTLVSPMCNNSAVYNCIRYTEFCNPKNLCNETSSGATKTNIVKAFLKRFFIKLVDKNLLLIN